MNAKERHGAGRDLFRVNYLKFKMPAFPMVAPGVLRSRVITSIGV